QGEAGGDIAIVKSGVLSNFGYHPAESVGFMAGGRLGFAWFQVDRHLALGVSGGARYMANLAYEAGGDLPLAWDASIDLRYTFYINSRTRTTSRRGGGRACCSCRSAPRPRGGGRDPSLRSTRP